MRTTRRLGEMHGLKRDGHGLSVLDWCDPQNFFFFPKNSPPNFFFQFLVLFVSDWEMTLVFFLIFLGFVVKKIGGGKVEVVAAEKFHAHNTPNSHLLTCPR